MCTSGHQQQFICPPTTVHLSDNYICPQSYMFPYKTIHNKKQSTNVIKNSLQKHSTHFICSVKSIDKFKYNFTDTMGRRMRIHIFKIQHDSFISALNSIFSFLSFFLFKKYLSMVSNIVHHLFSNMRFG